MPTPLESGIRGHRVEFVAESAVGVAPADPTWGRYSDTVSSFTATPGLEIAERRGLGNIDPTEFVPGRESAECQVVYDLQRALSADPWNDGVTRNADNELANTHTIVEREIKVEGGADGGGIRIYTVVLGAYIDTATLTADPEDTGAVPVTLDYMAEKIRSFRIDQPSTSTTLDVASTDAADTTQTLTIEDDGAGTSEAVPLNGTTVATTTASFASIDAIHLDAETAGDVTVSVAGGVELARLYGQTSYGGAEGDLGVPLLGAGSHAAALGTAFENFIGDTIERPAGTDIGDSLNSLEMTVENNMESVPRNLRRPRLASGTRTVTVSVNLFGPTESHDRFIEHLQATENNIVWTLTNSTLTFVDAVLVTPGDRVYEAEEAVMQLDNEFVAKGLTVA